MCFIFVFVQVIKESAWRFSPDGIPKSDISLGNEGNCEVFITDFNGLEACMDWFTDNVV